MGRRPWDGINAVLVSIALVFALIGVAILRLVRIIATAFDMDASSLSDGQVFLYFYLVPFGPAFAVTAYLLATSLRRDPPTICVENRSAVDLTVLVEGIPDDHECRRFVVPAGTAVRRTPARNGGVLSVGTSAVAYGPDGTQVARSGEPLWVSQRWVIGMTGDQFFAELRSEAA